MFHALRRLDVWRNRCRILWGTYKDECLPVDGNNRRGINFGCCFYGCQTVNVVNSFSHIDCLDLDSNRRQLCLPWMHLGRFVESHEFQQDLCSIRGRVCANR